MINWELNFTPKLLQHENIFKILPFQLTPTAQRYLTHSGSNKFPFLHLQMTQRINIKSF